MRKLLNTGRVVHRYGEWRDVTVLVAVAVPLSMAHFLSTVFPILPGSAQAAPALEWHQISLSSIAGLLTAYGSYRLLRDHEHHDYIEDAGHYRRHGWLRCPRNQQRLTSESMG